jgi:hypothetical protein
MNTIKIDTPDSFFQIIPKNIQENIEFRKKFAEISVADKGLQKTVLEMIAVKPQIAYNLLLWTFNPRNKAGLRHLPFILRPHQELAVDRLKDAIDNQHDELWEKSRDEGATELISKYFALEFMLSPGGSYLVGSRKEDYVDSSTCIDLTNQRVTGSARSIFHKILYGICHVPAWMHPAMVKTHMHIENLDNGTVIDGEATNENFGAGDRRTAILLDEFGRVEPRVAQSIRDSVADVSDCVLYNSTHFYGRSHPFAKLRFSGKIKVFCLPWWRNPAKTEGLYRSPSLNYVSIRDVEYYKTKYPGLFDNIKADEPFKHSDFEVECMAKGETPQLSLIADGSDKWRSQWYDKECTRRDPWDIATNLDMNPMGSTEMLFDPMVLQRIRVEYCRKPNITGEIYYKLKDKNNFSNIEFKKDWGSNRLKLWQELKNGRLNQSHNYIVSCDISLGTGASNSTATIVDVNTNEKIGSFVSPHLSPEEFTTYIVALCHWVGGASGRPFLTWESNGVGQVFNKRRRELGYSFVYIDVDERKRSATRRNVYGWCSGKPQKFDLLMDLRTAIGEGIRSNPQYKSLIIYDEDSINEYDDYIFYENRDIGLSLSEDESSGAQSAHGDRVIADGMAVKAMSVFHKAAAREMAKENGNSIAYRRYLYEKEQKDKKRNEPW